MQEVAQSSTQEQNVILELKNIVKVFPGVTALNGVNLQLRSGEIHAIMGENGAGKSTLIKIITGVHQPDGGEIYLNGKQVVIRDPLDAINNKRIAAIYQHSTSYPYLSVCENIFMCHEKLKSGLGILDWKTAQAEAAKLLAELGSDIDPNAKVGTLSVAERQIVEIAKAVSTNTEILIMDEPTAALSKREYEKLYQITKELRDRGVSIIFISHRMEDLDRLADRVTVLRDAHYIGTWDIDKISRPDLIAAMVGRQVTQLYPKRDIPIGETVLEVKNLGRIGYFKDVSFSVHRGEIFGLSGLVGAGRTEVCEAVAGITRYDEGEVYIDGQLMPQNGPGAMMNAGLGLLPEDRQKNGLILQWEIYKNETLSTLEKFNKASGMDEKAECDHAKEVSERLLLKAKTVFDRAGTLSGGNQQKVVVAKLLGLDLKILIMDEPTKGVDVGAKSQIYEIIQDLAEKGYAIILISSEMPEIISIADRVGVMREGRMTKILPREEVTQELLLHYSMLEREEVRHEA